MSGNDLHDELCRHGTVCHITSVHKANDVRIFHKECVTLAQAGFETLLIGVDASVPQRGVSVIGLPNTGNRLQRMIKRATAAYRHALEARADIYHIHDVELLPYALLLKQRTGAKVIFDSHECFREDVIGKDWIPVPLRPIVGHCIGYVEDFIVKRLDLVIAATPHIADTFEGVAQKVVIVNNFPLEGEFGILGGNKAHRREGICYVGSISSLRGIIQFLDALTYVDAAVKVHIAGAFANEAIESAAMKHENWRRVNYYGQVSREFVCDIYDRCFAGIVTFLPAPNHIYSQPNKLFEYMSAGLAVICSHFPMWRGLIEDIGCGIAVNPAEPLEIAAAINKLSCDRALSAQMGAQGRSLTKTKYSWSAEGRRLVEAYDELLRG